MNDYSEKKAPVVSVIIPLYNHEKYIKEAVESVLNQTFQEFELIIINDGSTDDSEIIVDSIKDDRINYYSQQNAGAHNTINRGIELSSGEFISILNSDDIYEKSRLEECLSVIDGNTSISAVFSCLEWIDGKGAHIRYLKGVKDICEKSSEETSFISENNLFLDLLSGNFLSTTSNLFCRKNVFDEIEPFRNFRYAHDYDFFLRLSCRFDVHIIDKSLLKYRIHEKNTINENKPETFFELGLIYSDLVINYDFKNHIPDADDFSIVSKFFHSISPHFSERMIVALLFQAIQAGNGDFLEELMQNPENSFRKSCVEYLSIKVNESRALHESAILLNQAEAKLNEKEQVVSDLNSRLHERSKELKEKDAVIKMYQNSPSFAVGRIITWPFRKLYNKLQEKFAGKSLLFNLKTVHQKPGINTFCLDKKKKPGESGSGNKISEEMIPQRLQVAFNELVSLCGDDVSHVFLIPWLVRGGSDLVTLNYIHALSDNNLSKNIVAVATENAASPWKERLPEKVGFINWGEKYHQFSADDQEYLLNALLMKISPEVVHNINSNLGFRVFIRYGKRLRESVKLYACSFCEDITKEGELVGYSIWYIPKCFKHLEAVLSDNITHLKKLKKEHQLDFERMFVNYQPAPVVENRKKISVKTAQNKTLEILWAGRIDRQKRPDTLIRIAEKCKERPFIFHVYGSPLLEKDVYTNKFEASENIKYHGEFDNGLSTIDIDQFDLFLYTSQWDGLPNILIEAMALGLPIISSNVGGINELVQNDRTGFLIDPFDDVDQYINRLVMIYENPSVLVEIVSNSGSLIDSRHSPEEFKAGILNIPGYCLNQ